MYGPYLPTIAWRKVRTMPGPYVIDQILIFCFLGLTAWAACSDALYFRIPNAVSLGLVALYPAHVLCSPTPIDWMASILVAGLLLFIGTVMFARGMIGGGDAKFLTAASLWAGPALTIQLLVIMGVVGGLLAIVLWARQYVRRFRAAGLAGLLIPDPPNTPIERVPYGIAIAAGAAQVGVQMLVHGI